MGPKQPLSPMNGPPILPASTVGPHHVYQWRPHCNAMSPSTFASARLVSGSQCDSRSRIPRIILEPRSTILLLVLRNSLLNHATLDRPNVIHSAPSQRNGNYFKDFLVFLQAWLLLASSLLIQVASEASPGLLKVPKVYNALVTSDQNLEPSRAYPVIQPVIHRTAIGYVPPFYYAPLGPGLVGPLPGEAASQTPVTDNPDAERVESAKNVEDASGERSDTRDNDDENQKRNGNKERVPLNFYPNDRSLFYNPYFYGYQPFPPVVPGPYYYDYHPGGPLLPIGLPPSALIAPAREPGQRKVEQSRRAKAKEIPDVAPPEPSKHVENSS